MTKAEKIARLEQRAEETREQARNSLLIPDRIAHRAMVASFVEQIEALKRETD